MSHRRAGRRRRRKEIEEDNRATGKGLLGAAAAAAAAASHVPPRRRRWRPWPAGKRGAGSHRRACRPTLWRRGGQRKALNAGLTGSARGGPDGAGQVGGSPGGGGSTEEASGERRAGRGERGQGCGLSPLCVQPPCSGGSHRAVGPPLYPRCHHASACALGPWCTTAAARQGLCCRQRCYWSDVARDFM